MLASANVIDYQKWRQLSNLGMCNKTLRVSLVYAKPLTF